MTRILGAIVGAALVSAGLAAQGGAPPAVPAVTPSTMARVGTVDLRFQSYNVEMVEVTGGRFWAPYGPALDAILAKAAADPAGPPAFRNPDIYAMRPPVDLASPRLRALAAALGPAYVRVSGTWANSTWFADSDTPPAAPPAGFGGVLTRQQWKGVIDFARAVDGAIVTSFATSAGSRGADGVWTPGHAQRWLAFTKEAGGRIAAAEFMNEPNVTALGGAPAGYDAAAYARDFKAFRASVKSAAPDMLIVGPGSVNESDAPAGAGLPGLEMIASRDMLKAAGPGLDAVSYHHYGAVSKRCAPMMQTSAAEALTDGWLSRTDTTFAFYKRLRDEFEPGKPLWLTETADAACGGNPWGSTFLDTFRYLDQMGRLAKQGLSVVMHNTLVASAYGLLDEDTFAPKPNYWGALLWRRVMGATVLDAGVPAETGLRVYAHCQRNAPGGVALLVINTSTTATRMLQVPAAGGRYTLSAATLQSPTVQLNGQPLVLGAGDELPGLVGAPVGAGRLRVAPATITFVELPAAGNPACR